MLATFEQERPHLFGIAYRLLGSVMDAEDMVQETFLRWQQADTAAIASPRAYLTTVITRLSIDQLRLAQSQRESYIGPWLPAPLLTVPANSERMAILSESLSTAFLLLLEQLAPTERAVYLLRQVFEYEYADIAAMVDKSEANCRQLVRRARQRIAAQRPRFETAVPAHEPVLIAFAEACLTGDVAQLMVLLAENVVAHSDGGGKVQAAQRPVQGSRQVARFLIGIGRFAPAGLAMRLQLVNESYAFVGYVGDRPIMVMLPKVVAGRIEAIYTVLNPDKLSHLPLLGTETDGRQRTKD